MRYNNLSREEVNKSFLTKPTFIGVGAGRCGTSALWFLLKEHKDIFMSPLKELNYFGIKDKESDPHALTFNEYLNCFKGAECGQAIGEFSPAYLTHAPSLRNLYTRLPDVKLIVTLRDPLSRLKSQFKHHSSKHGFVNLNEYVSSALSKYEKGYPNDADWHAPLKNLYQSLYFEGIDFILSNFKRNNVLFVRHNDFVAEPKAQVNNICEFIGVESFSFTNVTTNQSSAGDLNLDLDETLKERVSQLFNEDMSKLSKKYGIQVV